MGSIIPQETSLAAAPPRRRLFLVSVPRTASNLLVRVLNIKNQPNVLTNPSSGYFFKEAYLTAASKGYHNVSESPDQSATDHPSDSSQLKSEIRDTYQRCLDTLEAASAQASRENKVVFTKEHAFWFVNPATMKGDDSSEDNDGSRAREQDCFRLDFPQEIYGQAQTFSENNKTLFPDEYLSTWQFAFIIRHPALAWPSMYRAMQGMAKIGMLDEDGIKGSMVTNMTWRWSRKLFEWCDEKQASMGVAPPLILDAYDVIHNPDVVLNFCEKTGLDKSVVQFEWGNDAGLSNYKPEPRAQPLPQESQNGHGDGDVSNNSDEDEAREKELAAVNLMTSTLRASKGVIKDKTPAVVDIDAEIEKWKEEFGPEGAALIEKTVRDTMPDYEYLRERSLKV
ncbi:hypothetical protein QBC43DRAFT_309902 [Cladorrhinum sp. PSN259]|nr:hypothetical protein QBC43DRAFT_309902 [Cladorrhinum sp. PSN259]